MSTVQPQNIKNVAAGLQDLLQGLMDATGQAGTVATASEKKLSEIAQSLEKRLAEHPQIIDKKIADAVSKHVQEMSEEMKIIRQEFAGSINGLDNATKAAIKAVGDLEVKIANLAKSLDEMFGNMAKSMTSKKFIA
jgi:predicted translin family RNA/ssDNA-binding protein